MTQVVTTNTSKVMQSLEWLLIQFWKRRAPVTTPRLDWKTGPADNLQQCMNLVMPLSDKSGVGRAMAAKAVASSVDEIFTGLSNVGTVHFARFDLIGANLCMFSVYDGDFANYIRDFISVFGSVFDALMLLVEDPPPLPSELHSQSFIEWIRMHDAFQIPGEVTLLFPHEPDIVNLPRDVILLLEQNRNVQLGRYSAYPGLSAAQIRLATGVDW